MLFLSFDKFKGVSFALEPFDSSRQSIFEVLFGLE
jgi:hypothetical protein